VSERPDPVAALLAVDAACDIVFIAPARPGDELTADAVRRAGYGRSGLYDITVRRPPDGALIPELRGQARSPRTP
jgi:acyl-CoA thioesterase